jgi:hypothetical protein
LEGVGRGVSGQTIVFIYTLVKPNKRVAGRDSQFPGFGFTKLLKNNFSVTFLDNRYLQNILRKIIIIFF